VTLTEFLALLVPPGVLVAGKLVSKTNAVGEEYKTFSHAIAKLHSDFAANLVRMDREQKSTYFALAAYKQGFHDGPIDPKTGQAKKQLRVRTNVESLKALWLDIDFKGKNGKPPIYPDIKTAAVALRVFSQATGIPTPSVLVSTGNGIHVYWPLDQAVPLDRWQRLADALKAAAIEHKVDIDPTRAADAASVLRPIGTSNWKDPGNPKPVQLLHSSGKVFSYDELEGVLIPWVGKTRAYGSVAASQSIDKTAYGELTGGLVPRNEVLSRFDTIIKHCGVARMIAESHGEKCPEPLWTGSLQLLKHCEDGALWVHPISDGHPGYNSDDAERKWQQRLANSAGPTLCSTFEAYEPAICGKCPHRGFVKTPIQLGHEDSTPLEGLPNGWRIAPDRKGTERLMIDPANNHKEWVKVLRHVPTNFRATRSIVTQRYDLSFDVEFNGSKSWTIDLPGGALGNPRKLNETLADYGFPLKERESKSFGDLMTTWLGQLQAARRVADVTEQLGWLIEKHPDGEHIAGFSCGQTTFYADGRVRNDVRAAREFAPISKFYEPKGGLDAWKKVAVFLSDQNKAAFTAIVAAAFGAPLLRFTGLSGGILSIVSTASGVGKSSALKCSQAVWGSPTHGMNAVDDTPKSVARKLGFLNNLPAYWDELRGRKTVEDFLTLAFQVTQGKEKTRLDSSAQLREVSTWETMLVVASNESIFEAMARHGGGSDAGIVRTFEIVIEPFASDRNRAELSLLFDALNSNYGHAGRIYAQWLATHAGDVDKRVQGMFKKLATGGKMEAQERFWFAIAAVLIVGAELAGELNLLKLDVRHLAKFLLANIYRLRGRSVDAMTLSQPTEILAAFLAAYQDRALVVDRFPKGSNLKNYIPDLTGGIPRADKIVYHVSRTEELLRIPRNELERWLEYRQLPVYSILKKMKDDLGAIEIKAKLGIGTKWELPPQKVFEFQLARFGLKAADIKVGGPSSLDGIPDSPSQTVPEDSTQNSSRH
jgi:hypothetical protein